MAAASLGYIPTAGALLQVVIDVAVILNALWATVDHRRRPHSCIPSCPDSGERKSPDVYLLLSCVRLPSL
jgi:hypothetical protein